MGLASYSTAPVQLTGSGQFTDLATSFGATAGYGFPSSVYGAVGVSTTSKDGDVGHRLGLSARAGYQLVLDPSRRIEVCPTASFGLDLGPNDDAAGVNRSGRTATAGINVGMILGANRRMQVVPSAGFSFAHGSEKAENAAGATLFEISGNYTLAQIGIGVILNSTISVRPSIDIPLGMDVNTPTVGLTVGYNFGRSLP
jgi:hypothetical protein